jgi:hypothetical protein
MLIRPPSDIPTSEITDDRSSGTGAASSMRQLLSSNAIYFG